MFIHDHKSVLAAVIIRDTLINARRQLLTGYTISSASWAENDLRFIMIIIDYILARILHISGVIVLRKTRQVIKYDK